MTTAYNRRPVEGWTELEITHDGRVASVRTDLATGAMSLYIDTTAETGRASAEVREDADGNWVCHAEADDADRVFTTHAGARTFLLDWAEAALDIPADDRDPERLPFAGMPPPPDFKPMPPPRIPGKPE